MYTIITNIITKKPPDGGLFVFLEYNNLDVFLIFYLKKLKKCDIINI
ncbi:hypothetical protein X274_03995 [Marinitoga sp. 1155]|nr:hypothetical protein X274_03995 [Marinitoga sp. 1155]